MLPDRSSDGLKEWMRLVEDSTIPELSGFANGLQQDFEPVKMHSIIPGAMVQLKEM